MAFIGTLGQLPFVCSSKKVLTFNNLKRTNSVRWARHEIIGKKPKLEFMGADLSTASLTMRFDSSLNAPPLFYLNRVKKMLDNRMYKTLIIGGDYMGKFVMEEVEEERLWHNGAGVCIAAEVRIALTEWTR